MLSAEVRSWIFFKRNKGFVLLEVFVYNDILIGKNLFNIILRVLCRVNTTFKVKIVKEKNDFDGDAGQMLNLRRHFTCQSFSDISIFLWESYNYMGLPLIPLVRMRNKVTPSSNLPILICWCSGRQRRGWMDFYFHAKRCNKGATRLHVGMHLI